LPFNQQKNVVIRVDVQRTGMFSLKTLSCLKTVLRQVFSVLVLVLVLVSLKVKL